MKLKCAGASKVPVPVLHGDALVCSGPLRERAAGSFAPGCRGRVATRPRDRPHPAQGPRAPYSE